MAAGGFQLIGLHRHAGDERRHVIGRTAEHAVGEIGDTAMTDHAPLQILARTRAQKIDRVAAAVLLERHLIA
jgi:hypothetical protein